MISDLVQIHPEVKQALADNRPVVALESTIISHGLPWPENLQCAQSLETLIRQRGATPATIAIAQGQINVGLQEDELVALAQADNVVKVSRPDLGSVLASGERGATTVAATMICANLAGIHVFATGGIGGVHRGAETTFDISADLTELSQTPVTVVCAGAKSILDLPKTLEVLETYGVPVLGFGCDELPAFYTRQSGLMLTNRVDSAEQVAHAVTIRRRLGLSGGEVITVPIPVEAALPSEVVDGWIEQALCAAEQAQVSGKAITPFLLAQIVEASAGKALAANLALVRNNAQAAADIATALAQSS